MMNGSSIGSRNAGSQLAALAIALVLGVGLTGCKIDSEKTDGAKSGGTVTNPPTSGGNTAPTISGTPVTIAKVTLQYSYQPNASDADGDRLTFSIQGQPDWATFDPASGLLQGVPPTGSNGTYTGVQISVSDGTTSTTLAPFSITVSDPIVGSAELAWQPPMANEDGSALTDLSGYVIRYGKTSGALDQSIRITNPGTTAYVVDQLIEGTWYFTLSSVNTAGVESRPTGYVSKTIG
jgi:hypothetical protein